MCPRKLSRDRSEQEECNTHECVGDEICIAHQDLVLTLDGSGSLRESGFEVVRAFAANLTDRYQSMYYGREDMKIGVVEFGNGDLESEADGSTSIKKALYIQGITADLGLVREKVEALHWLQGFTNMAQGLHEADVMLGQTGRAEAQSAIMVISDGKFSMEFQTAEKARELKDKNVMLYLVAITEVKGKDLQTFRRFASRPSESNFVRIPGLAALKYNADLFTGQIIAKFCPNSFSPSMEQREIEKDEYMLAHQNGYPSSGCGAWTWNGYGFNPESCMQKALEQEVLSFSFGKGKYAFGGCYSEAVHVDMDYWNAILNTRTNPPCPDGAWVGNPYYDTYIIKPQPSYDFATASASAALVQEHKK
jgi:hypothetical protein